MSVEELLVDKSDARVFSRNLRAMRAFAGLDQRELAAKAGVDRSTISLLENGRHKPQMGTLKKLAAALDVSPETLAG
jgi:putative transcriptional regulator